MGLRPHVTYIKARLQVIIFMFSFKYSWWLIGSILWWHHVSGHKNYFGPNWLIRAFWTSDLTGIDAITAGNYEVGICTVNLCLVRDLGVPALDETDMICGVVPSVRVLGLLVTKPMLNCVTVTLSSEVDVFFYKDLSL